MKYIVLVICMMLVGCNSYEKRPSVKEQYAGKEVYVYIFNDKTQLWDRARVETLRSADCGKIRLLTSQEGGGGEIQ